MALQSNIRKILNPLISDRAISGEDSALIKKNINKNLQSNPLKGEWHLKSQSLEEQLYNARALCKIKTAEVAMYLPEDLRKRFFLQLDNLMDAENWEEDDRPITEASFVTFLRMLLLIRPDNSPGIGATSEGNIIAAWTNEKDRLTIECRPGDRVRWVLSRYIEENRESAAGEISLTRLLAALSPYNAGYWFSDDSQKKRANTK